MVMQSIKALGRFCPMAYQRAEIGSLIEEVAGDGNSQIRSLS